MSSITGHQTRATWCLAEAALLFSLRLSSKNLQVGGDDSCGFSGLWAQGSLVSLLGEWTLSCPLMRKVRSLGETRVSFHACACPWRICVGHRVLDE